MMNIYEENLEFIKSNYPYIEWDEEERKRCEEEEIRVFLGENECGQMTVGIAEGGHLWILGSGYDAELAADCWSKGFEDVGYRTIFVIIGLGNGVYIKKLHERYSENVIILCEPNRQIFCRILQEIKLSEILSKEVFLAAGKTAEILYVELLQKLITYDNMRQIRFAAIPNYEESNEIAYTRMRESYVNRVERIIMGRNTRILDEMLRADNMLQNLFWYPNGYSLGQLADSVAKLEPEKRAAIVVAAGPSLDKNVKELQRAKNRACIIAVDTALKTLLKAGVVPDLALLVDPAKDPSLFDREELLTIPLCTSVFANSVIMKRHTGRKFFATTDTEFTEELARRYDKKMYTMHSGGSVANNAFSVAGMMGFKTIILVGQDLAYPNGRVHSAEAYENEAEIELSDRYFQVEDIYGGKVYTEANMDAYRRWFEEQIDFNPDYRIIDATEGGAKIRGAEIMPLSDAIGRECSSVKEVDFREAIESQHPLFSETEQEEIREIYRNIASRLDELESALKKQQKNYKNLEKLEKTGQTGTFPYKALVKDVVRLTEKMEKDSLMEWVHLYQNQVEYAVFDELNNELDKRKSESMRATVGGQKVCKAYIENIEKLKTEWKCLLRENHYLE